MATTKRELSQKINSDGKSEIILRLSIGRGVQPRIKTGLYIKPAQMKKGGAIIKPRLNTAEAEELQQLEAELSAIEHYLIKIAITTPKEHHTKEYFAEQLDRYRYPEKYLPEDPRNVDFFTAFDQYIEKHQLSKSRVSLYKGLGRALRRYELYIAATGTPRRLTLDGMTTEDVESLETFLRTEPELYDKYPQIYAAVPVDTHKLRKQRRPLPKGDNTICCIFKRLRAFFNWCNAQGMTDNRPFAKYTGVTTETYGTPYYITIEERDRIAAFDLSSRKELEIQRDIFVFHCLIGCRVSDLLRLTAENIIDGAVEYIASKTIQEHPDVIRVPLHPRAAALIDKYAGHKPGKLFPFISSQKYNDAIKRIFTVCGITRHVTILNPTTGREEQRPINEIASSHIARRTFVGNLYKRVKDPNLVGKLSGHKEGSRAFTRYRDIDEDMKKELINLLGD